MAQFSNVDTQLVLHDPSDILYLDNHTYLIADTGHHCIRRLYLPILDLTTYAGQCGENGSYSEEPTTIFDARFIHPRGMLYEEQRKHLHVICEMSVLFIDMVLETVNRAYSSSHRLLNGFIASDNLLISYQHGVKMFKIGTETVINEIGAGNKCAFVNGRYAEARFCYPNGLIVANNMVAFITDTDNNLLRMVDFQLKRVRTVCNEAGHVVNDGRKRRIGKCSMTKPWGVAMINDTLYIGTNTGIQSAKVYG